MAQKTRRVSHGVAVSTLFSAIALLYGTAAYGGFYPGHIDPGGNGLDIPGFTGDAVFDIPAGCFSNGFHFTNNFYGGSGGCGSAFVYSANIDLYTVSTSDPPNPGTVVGTFDLSSKPTDFWDILGVYVVDGALAGVDTHLMGPNPGTGDWFGSNFWLEFVSGQIDPAYISLNAGDTLSPAGTVIFGPECTDPTNCRVAAAPEPGTLGLILGALGGGWLARRRKGKAAA